MGWNPSTSLGGIDGFENEFGIDLRRQGQLDEDAVDGVVAVEVIDELQHLAGGDSRGRSVHPTGDAELFAGGDFAFYVKLRSGIIADKHGGQAGANALGGHGGDFDLELGEDGVADFKAVKNAGSHAGETPVGQRKS